MPRPQRFVRQRWVGGAGSRGEKLLGGNGRLVIGIHGRSSARDLEAIGLMQTVEQPPTIRRSELPPLRDRHRPLSSARHDCESVARNLGQPPAASSRDLAHQGPRACRRRARRARARGRRIVPAERTAAPTGDDHCRLPLRSTAWTVPALSPKYSIPSAANTGVDSTGPAVSYSHEI